MCGIAGVLDSRHDITNQKPIFREMMNTLKNRGPNDEGIYTNRHVALIHTRLAVVDPENGQQPMFYKEDKKRYVIVYNGELYNTNKVRKELIELGYEFKSHSDTEVVLRAYVAWKEKCVEHFNGIFAFAIWDDAQECLFLARDRVGVKPLFYASVHDTFLFASEIKALLAHPLLDAEIDAHGIAEIMLIGPGRTPGCGVFKHVMELKGGEYAFVRGSAIEKHRYFTLRDHPHTDSEEQTIKKVRELVVDAVQRQLVSDVPIGTFLSGGLDSSLISSVASRTLKERGKRLKTFSVDYTDNAKYFKASHFQPNSDADFIGKMVKYLDSDHTFVTIGTDELIDSLFAAVDARDLPGMADVDGSLLLFAKEIKKKVTVALSGECADEIFGGYPWYRDKDIREADGFPWSQSTLYRTSFMHDKWLKGYDAGDYVHQRYQATCDASDKLSGTVPLEARMKEMMNLNVNWFMQTLLDRKDRMTMYSGLEVRVPFCDHRILEYLYTVPWSFKDYQGREKGLLRIAMKDYLPEEILWRKKSPYPKTHHPAYLKKLREMLAELLQEYDAPLWQIVKPEAAEKLLSNESAQPWYGQLMTTPQTIAYFLQVNYWLKKYHIKISE